MTPGPAAFIGLLARYLMPGDSASPLVVQKLLYFLQEAGQPLKPTFTKQTYGPYADQVRHAVLAMEGHFVTGLAMEPVGSRGARSQGGRTQSAAP
jgi:uncharacterized protein YwgA